MGLGSRTGTIIAATTRVLVDEGRACRYHRKQDCIEFDKWILLFFIFIFILELRLTETGNFPTFPRMSLPIFSIVWLASKGELPYPASQPTLRRFQTHQDGGYIGPQEQTTASNARLLGHGRHQGEDLDVFVGATE